MIPPSELSLLPPLVAIALAIATRRVLVPLAMGVMTGAILLARSESDPTWLTPIRIFYETIWGSVSEWPHVQALMFSLLLGAMVGVLEIGGSMRDLIQRLSRRVRSRCGAQSMIAISGMLIFFDDYANTLLLGGTMRGTVDRYGISRAKLAYLVDSTAAPVAGLAVVSTWAATEISYMAEGLVAGGVTDSTAAFELFLYSIPYRFYPWLALAFVMMVALTGRDFGPMRVAEAEASKKPRQDEMDDQVHARHLWVAAVVPVVVCIATVAAVLMVTGASAVPVAEREKDWLRLAGQIFGNGDSYLALVVGGGMGLVTALGLHFGIGGVASSTLSWGVVRGAWQMMPAMFVLWLAWSLSDMTKPESLNTGGFLKSVLSDRLDPRLLPSAVFILAGGVAFSTGTSWGTMAILTPFSIELALSLDPVGPAGTIVLATTGAVLAGAIFGDHCSPISDTTVLSSRASGCDHMLHVRTQMPYALVVGAISIVLGTLPAALGFSPWLLLLAASVILWLLLRVFGHQVPPN